VRAYEGIGCGFAEEVSGTVVDVPEEELAMRMSWN
jgi:hypothetical protein